MIRHEFSGKRFLAGLIVFLFGFPFFFMGNAPTGIILFALTLSLIGIGLMIWAFRAKSLWCADCGYYLGTKPESCPRCGCNVYTEDYRGVGHTYREGPKNY